MSTILESSEKNEKSRLSQLNNLEEEDDILQDSFPSSPIIR